MQICKLFNGSTGQSKQVSMTQHTVTKVTMLIQVMFWPTRVTVVPQYDPFTNECTNLTIGEISRLRNLLTLTDLDHGMVGHMETSMTSTSIVK